MSMLNVSPTPIHPDSGRRLIAYILSPRLWHLPTRSKISECVSSAVDGYRKGLDVMVKSAAMTLGFKGVGMHAVPGAYPLDLESNEQQVKSSTTAFERLKEDEAQSSDERLRAELEGGNQGLAKRNQTQSVILCMEKSSVVSNGPYSPPHQAITKLTEEHSCSKDEYSSAVNRKEGPKCTPYNISTDTVVGESAVCTATPPLQHGLNAMEKYEQSRKYAGVRTLRLPGKQLQPMKPPSEALLALRQIDEELAVEASQLDEYCARELAGKGISLRLPEVAKSQPGAMAYPRTARRIWRESSIGPVNPSWGNSRLRDIPTIQISKPGVLQIPSTVEGSIASQKLPALGANHAKQGRSRSNAVYIPPKGQVSLSAPLTGTYVDASLPESTDGRSNLGTFKQSELVNSAKETPEDRAKRLSKNRTSMSDWLATISTGNNTLVADHVVMKAAPVLRSSLILTCFPTPPLSPVGSSSSSDSSTPSTPVDDLFLPPPLVKETKAVYASGDYRRRARCSYSGDEYEIVGSPVIPEELLTDEIGVAC